MILPELPPETFSWASFIKIIILSKAIMLYNQQLINPPHPPQVSISICRLEIQSPNGAPSYLPVSKWTWLGLCSASMSNDFHLKHIFVPGRRLHLLLLLFILLSFRASPGLGIKLSDLQLTSLAPGPHQPLENPMLLKLLSNCKIHSFFPPTLNLCSKYF